MKYILGVDVGGSKTHIAIAASDGTILADTQTTGTIYTDTGIDAVMKILQDAVGECLKLALLKTDDISIGVFGMTGIDWPFELKLHKEALEAAFPEIDTIIACNDALVALQAAVKKDWGVILCSGTGFNAAAISPEGDNFTFGFYENAPHCGGKSLGRKIIKAVCDSTAGLMPETMLSDIVLKHFDVSDTDHLLMRFTQCDYTKDMLTALPAKLFHCYDAKDPVAGILVANMLDELTAHAVAAIHNLGMEHDSPDIAISGGMLKSAPKEIAGAIAQRIKKKIPEFNLYFSRSRWVSLIWAANPVRADYMTMQRT
jgi:N-acetylglucosamine kinase-like BadF-type ATPase